VLCGSHLLAAKLRRANIDIAGAVGEIEAPSPSSESAWPELQFSVLTMVVGQNRMNSVRGSAEIPAFRSRRSTRRVRRSRRPCECCSRWAVSGDKNAATAASIIHGVVSFWRPTSFPTWSRRADSDRVDVEALLEGREGLQTTGGAVVRAGAAMVLPTTCVSSITAK
jgi:hypothetical protein